MPTDKNKDLQCLRAIAIILVMMLHYRYRLPTTTGYSTMLSHFSPWTGVDIFFAISGFLICHTFLRDLRNSGSTREALVTFWIRRVGRLFPAVAFWVGVSVWVASIAAHTPDTAVKKVFVSGVAALFGVSNAFLSYCKYYWGPFCGNSDFNGVTWSLSLEWQLYAALSILFVCFGKKWGVSILLLVAAVMSAFPAPQGFDIPWAFRMQAFSLGATLFLVLDKDGSLPTLRIHPFANISLLIAGVLICVLAPIQIHQPFVLPAVAVGALLCLLSTLSETSYTRYRISTPFIWIGERSYSIYLCHLPIYLVTREILARSVGLEATRTHIILGFVVAVTAIALCSDLSYRFIELPFQKITRQYLARKRESKQLWNNARHSL